MRLEVARAAADRPGHPPQGPGHRHPGALQRAADPPDQDHDRIAVSSRMTSRAAGWLTGPLAGLGRPLFLGVPTCSAAWRPAGIVRGRAATARAGPGRGSAGLAGGPFRTRVAMLTNVARTPTATKHPAPRVAESVTRGSASRAPKGARRPSPREPKGAAPRGLTSDKGATRAGPRVDWRATKERGSRGPESQRGAAWPGLRSDERSDEGRRRHKSARRRVGEIQHEPRPVQRKDFGRYGGQP